MKILSKCFLVMLISLVMFYSCSPRKTADHIYYNGKVYTVDSNFTICSAFAVTGGKITAVGSDAEILEYDAKEKTDLDGKFVYPGFQDAHCHFYGYGNDLKKIWLTGTGSFEAIIDTLIYHRDQTIGGWIFGRGWDQNDWVHKEYPDNSKLDSLFPDIPVFLLRVDGHAALVNQKALDLAGITADTKISGGIVETKDNRLTGILVDNAVDRVYEIIPKPGNRESTEALFNAQKDCFAVGLTSVTDAGIESTGLKWSVISLIDSLQKNGSLKMRINAMAALEELDRYRQQGKYKTEMLNVRSFKLYTDGSLGSRGACLLESYSDRPGHKGFLIHDPSYLDSIAAQVALIGFQLNSHCIGDSSQRLMLQLYEKHTKNLPDHRWRIEHAQVINPADMVYYSRNHIIPSMQPVHATSDMYWAEVRIGSERVKGAYALKQMLEHAGMLAAGSDFPVEHINPLFGFYAAVARKDQKGFPEDGYMKNNALSREEALKAMTIWSAYASFTDMETGSLESGKFADFVILEEDLMKVPEEQIWQLKVHSTYVNGNEVYLRPE